MNTTIRTLALAGCLAFGAMAGGGGAAQADTLRVAIGIDPVSLDPIATSDNASIWTQLLLYDTLIRPAADGRSLEPGLAESWSVSDDGLTLDFRLRPARFADGTPVTAEDVRFSLERAASEESRWRRFFNPVTAIEVLSEHDLRLTLDAPFTPAFNNLALFSAAILPKARLEAEGEGFFAAPVGSGPFVLRDWARGSRLVLEANPHYWREGLPHVARAELEIVTEGSARVIRLEAGEVDVILDPPLSQLSALEARAEVNVGRTVPYRSDFVLLNTTRAPFDDIRVRQALNLAIDKQALIDGVLYGAGSIAASAMPPMTYADPDLAPWPHDPEQARALLAEAGLADGFSAELLVISGIAAHRNVAVALQAMLQQVGVQLDIQLMEGGTHWQMTGAGTYDMALSYSTSDTIDPDQLVGFLAVNPERANAYHTEWRSDRVNELYALERATVDGPEREAMFREIVEILHTEAPYIFLYHPAAVWAARDTVEGFAILPTSNFRLEEVQLNR